MGSLLSGVLGAGASLIGQNAENQFNASQAQQQMNFQDQMSSTAYQRASADMQKAGLNPLMMYGSGGPASTPSGAMAPQTQNAGTAAVETASSSAQAYNASQSTQSQVELNNALKKKAASDTVLNLTNASEKKPWANIGEAVNSGLNSAKSIFNDLMGSDKFPSKATPSNTSEGGWHGIVPRRP